jgi:hypothetical protein
MNWQKQIMMGGCSLVFCFLGAVAQPPVISPSFEAQVVTKGYETKVTSNKEKRIERLRVGDIHLLESGVKQKILRIEETKKPLSIVFIVNLGVDIHCGLTSLGRLLGLLSASLEENLQPEDEVAIALTTQSEHLVLKFSDSTQRRVQLLGTKYQWRGEIEQLNIRTGNPESVSFLKNESAGIFENHTNKTETIYLQERNYVATALNQSLDYLNNSKKKASRPVIIFVNNIHNVVPYSQETVDAFEQLIFSQNVLVNWVGQPARIPYPDESFFSTPSEKISWSGRDYFVSLVERTGGTTISCFGFEPSVKESRGNQLFIAGAKRLFESLRTRYKITYESDNSDLTQPRNIRLEMSPQWKGGKVTLHYPKIIYPQALEK